MTRVALIVSLVLAVPASLALATTARDRDDVKTGLDVAKVSSSHNRASDELVTTVDFYEAVKVASMVSKDRPPSSICIEIWTRSTPGESPPDYEACAGADAKGQKWVGSIARKRDKGAPLRVGAVKVEQPSDTRVVLRVDPDDVKRPTSYRWRVEATSFGSDCKASGGCPDYAPDRPDTAQTKLSTARS